MLRFHLSCNRYSIWIWILSISILSLNPYAKREKMKVIVEKLSEDDKFVNKYGNDNTSGLWQPARDILDDIEKMKMICSQAHELLEETTPRFHTVGFYIRELNFPESPKYQPMDVDFFCYTLDYSNNGSNLSETYYFTKGLEEDCVYYGTPLDPKKLKMKLQKHVCGIKFKLNS